ncbi:MAG: VOC family protein [Polyangiaceae bacterium]
MDPRINLLTLGVSDIARARAFYRDGLGWKTAPGSSDEVVFFDLGGFVLGLFGHRALAEDAKLDPGPAPSPKAFRGMSIAHNCRSKKEVDDAMAAALRAGATLVKAAEDVFWGGYSGYFADPDGHLWEVAWNPHWTMLADGRLSLTTTPDAKM